jgi:hypothetical protein
MPRESCRGTAVLAVLLTVSGTFAESPSGRPAGAPAVNADSLSAALCGRGAGSAPKLASALDEIDPVAAVASWRQVEIDGFRRWLEAPICRGASESEARLYRSRRVALDQLSRRLQRAQAMEGIGSTLARFRGWRPSAREWPSSAECDACADLRSAAARVADIAARWPPRTSTKQLGARLDDAASRERLVAELCAARPAAGAWAEIERRFQYYSWTADGARLFEVAALFEQPEVVAGCQDR